ncbi:hypothetical protein [Limnofasciculus baicalensis]|uniref:Uncharacterized protein n=1 Tax=Limnofasciculus baicalensis BBK-W-15 TaxID=2699891 RepID=A0AAE3GLX9_9CYAN|nr:hypothetical protein [Limnofasciculus baicalensis]MCP2726995.1 hypothetical protein [Limnofasciculus baicalensis BBK-W-15]
MSELRFLCCGWEAVRRIENANSPSYGSFKDSRGYKYKVSMFSQETLINARQDWHKIPFFYVDVIATARAVKSLIRVEIH